MRPSNARVKVNEQPSGQGDEKRKTLAVAVLDDFVVAIGPFGFSFEIGEFEYNGKNYTIISLGHAMGWDISAGFNIIAIKGDPNTFNPNDLSGYSGQNNYSFWIYSWGKEKPFIPDACGPYYPKTYISKAKGLSIGYSFIGVSRVTGYSWIMETPEGPTLTELYKRRPGGY